MRSAYVLITLALLANPNSSTSERDRLYKAAATSLRALNALLTALLGCRRRKAVTLCNHCDPWVELLHNGKASSEVFEEGLDDLADEPDPT